MALRKVGLENLKTEHLYFNHTISLKDNIAICKCDFTIKRFSVLNDAFFHSYGKYTFELEFNEFWQITKITQMVEKNEGNENIHAAFKK